MRGRRRLSDDLNRLPRQGFHLGAAPYEPGDALAGAWHHDAASARETAFGQPFCFTANFHLGALPSKPIELPPNGARAFICNMRAFHKEESSLKRDEIAARQLHVLKTFGAH
jgi:hypothetical protein